MTTSPPVPIAVRNLVLSTGDLKKSVTVNLYAPRQSPEGSYLCEYQVIGMGDEKMRFGTGVDAVQALLLSLTKIGVDLYTSEEVKVGRVSWFDESNLGLPVFVRDIVPGGPAAATELFL